MRSICLYLLCLACWSVAGEVQARDVRLALLVGHERGWRKDPPLKYALSGDVMPMKWALQRAGFATRALRNPTPATLRKALVWVKRRIAQSPRVTTFFFYYSGHADRNALHLGPKTKHPLTYRELVRFFRRLRVKRRIAVIDACFSGEIVRHFGSLSSYRQLVRKGARGIRRLNLSGAFPNQGEQSGLQILTSSLHYAWESKRYRASIFTHYLLKGLRGKADRDRDGKISVGELFNFASDAMGKEIRQKPLLIGVIRRTRAYALAPAYHSRLLIGPGIIGKIRVSVANFFWSRKKRRRRSMRLAVVHGRGHVEVEHRGICRRQSILLRKGKEARLHDRWKRVVCAQVARTRKGSIALPARLYMAPPLPRVWSLSLAGGVLGAGVLGGFAGGGQIGLWHRYVGLLLDVWTASSLLGGAPRTQLLGSARLAGGYHWEWLHGGWRFTLLTAAYIGIGVLAQDVNVTPNVGALWRFGGVVVPMLWLSQRWAISLGLDGGAFVGRFAGEVRPQFHGAAMLGVRFLIL